MKICNKCAAVLTLQHHGKATLVRSASAGLPIGGCDNCGEVRPLFRHELFVHNGRWCIASVSFGKDSLYMLLGLIERGYPLHEVVFYDTGMEFQAIYNTRNAVLPVLEAHGIIYTELRPEYSFLWKMFDKPVNGKNGFHHGYSWCGGVCRWGTTDKLQYLDRYAEQRNAIVYIGIAADEQPRLDKEHKEYKRHPLADWGITEAAALAGCHKAGYFWNEGNTRLYDVLDRVSCWCCANKNLKELKNIYLHMPEYWQKLKDLQARTDRPMKGAGKSGGFVKRLRHRPRKSRRRKAKRKPERPNRCGFHHKAGFVA